MSHLKYLAVNTGATWFLVCSFYVEFEAGLDIRIYGVCDNILQIAWLGEQSTPSFTTGKSLGMGSGDKLMFCHPLDSTTGTENAARHQDS